AHGQFFRPGYFLGYFQALLVVAFLFDISKAQMRTLVGFGALVFTAALYYSPASYQPAAQFKGDVFFEIVLVNVLSVLIHHYISSGRYARDEIYRRFAELGKYSAMLMHDIKGLMAAPILCSRLLKQELKEYP